jgi:hypothetical protein
VPQSLLHFRALLAKCITVHSFDQTGLWTLRDFYVDRH